MNSYLFKWVQGRRGRQPATPATRQSDTLPSPPHRGAARAIQPRARPPVGASAVPSVPPKLRPAPPRCCSPSPTGEPARRLRHERAPDARRLAQFVLRRVDPDESFLKDLPSGAEELLLHHPVSRALF
jgi:hypothetical protein